MTFVAATYTAHGWLALLIILLILVIFFLGIRAFVRGVNRGAKRVFRRR
jgi:hypothetical protein